MSELNSSMDLPLMLRTESPSVYLRQHMTEADDLACVEAVQEDPAHVDQFNNCVTGLYPSLEVATGNRTRMSIDGHLALGIWDDDNQLKGNVSALISKDKTEAKLEYWLRASATGHGYATLAVSALTDHLLKKHDRVFAEVHVDNYPSRDVMDRAKFTEVDYDDLGWGLAAIYEPKILQKPSLGRRAIQGFLVGARFVTGKLAVADLHPHEGKLRSNAMPNFLIEVPDDLSGLQDIDR